MAVDIVVVVRFKLGSFYNLFHDFKIWLLQTYEHGLFEDSKIVSTDSTIVSGNVIELK